MAQNAKCTSAFGIGLLILKVYIYKGEKYSYYIMI